MVRSSARFGWLSPLLSMGHLMEGGQHVPCVLDCCGGRCGVRFLGLLEVIPPCVSGDACTFSCRVSEPRCPRATCSHLGHVRPPLRCGDSSAVLGHFLPLMPSLPWAQTLFSRLPLLAAPSTSMGESPPAFAEGVRAALGWIMRGMSRALSFMEDCRPCVSPSLSRRWAVHPSLNPSLLRLLFRWLMRPRLRFCEPSLSSSELCRALRSFQTAL